MGNLRECVCLYSINKTEMTKHLSYQLNSTDSRSLFCRILELLPSQLEIPESKQQFQKVVFKNGFYVLPIFHFDFFRYYWFIFFLWKYWLEHISVSCLYFEPIYY